MIKKIYRQGMNPNSRNGFKEGQNIGHIGYGGFQKGNIPWNKDKKGLHLSLASEFKKGVFQGGGFKKGYIPWNKDKKLSEEHKINISNSMEGRKISDKTRQKIREKKLGRKRIDMIGNKLSKGRTPWLGKKHTLQTKIKQSSKKQGIPSEKWEKFISKEPYGEEFNLKFKNLIRKRDNQVCMNCGIHREKLNRALDTHHINYDKRLNIPQNLICLCGKCHCLTNYNRKYWTKLFQEKLSRLYGYEYSKNGEIIIEINKQTDKENESN